MEGGGMRTIIVIVSATLLAGCAGYEMNTGSSGQHTQLAGNVHACISVPPDGRYETQTYKGSGEATAESVNRAFAPYLDTTVLRTPGELQEAALSEAKQQGCVYLLYSQILHWEDRATEWSGKPDRAALKLIVFSVPGGKVLDSMTFHAKSSFFTFGGDHPQDLLYKPLKQYASELFNAGQKSKIR